MDVTKLVIHPIRLRIVHAMAGRLVLTSSQLLARMPKVSRATLYRHIGLLAEAGILEVVSEQRVRGAVERTYRIQGDRAVVTSEAAKAMSIEDHRQGFAAAMAAIMAEFSAYLDREGSNPFADAVSYRQFTLWLSPSEVSELVAEVRRVLVARTRNTPSADRALHLLSTILFPIEPPSPEIGQPKGIGHRV